MHFRAWLARAVVAISCIGPVAATQIHSLRQYQTVDIDIHSHSSTIESAISTRLRRQPSNIETNSPPDIDAVPSTCTTALSSLISLSSSTDNPSSLFACYNLLTVSIQTNTTFQADLRLYSLLSRPPTGPLSGASPSSMAILLTYPSSTQYTVQQADPSQSTNNTAVDDKSTTFAQVQLFTLSGILDPSLHLTRLNTTQLLSLLIPQISIQVLSPTDPNTLLQTTLPATSTVFFTTGKYTQLSRPEILQASNRDFAQSAIAAAESDAPFRLPGQTLAIFPTGLFVTASWLGMFLGVFSLSTIGKVRSRGVYRAAVAGRSALIYA